jgi:hypothetical protein
MTEYKILEDSSASSLNSTVSALARDGWIISFFSVSNAKSQYVTSELFSCVMERERDA